MNIITARNLSMEIYGHSAVAVNRNYAGTAFQLSGKTWEKVKSYNLKNKGLNVWVYDIGGLVFAGVELEEIPDEKLNLEKKVLSLSRYASFKHIGPYNMIKSAGNNMTQYLQGKGEEIVLPYIEIYGHWTSDESKLETTLIMALK